MTCPCFDPVTFGHLTRTCPLNAVPVIGYTPLGPCPSKACHVQHGERFPEGPASLDPETLRRRLLEVMAP